MEKITPETLKAWTDGELSAERHAEISALLAVDDELAQQAACFEASKLPYKAAMNLDIPAVPDDLRAQVAQWSQIAAGQQPVPAQNKQGSVQPSGAKPVYRMALAAAISLMMISGLGALLFRPAADPVNAWTQAIVTYQNFYVTETIAGIEVNPDATRQKLAQLRQTHPALPAMPPNLEALGYAFKRVQRLDFEGKPVLQMVFSQEGKRPLAICLMPDETALTEKFTQHDLLNSYVWQSNGVRAIVVAEEDAAQLEVIANVVQGKAG